MFKTRGICEASFYALLPVSFPTHLSYPVYWCRNKQNKIQAAVTFQMKRGFENRGKGVTFTPILTFSLLKERVETLRINVEAGRHRLLTLRKSSRLGYSCDSRTFDKARYIVSNFLPPFMLAVNMYLCLGITNICINSVLDYYFT
jgi:hypothetical protein